MADSSTSSLTSTSHTLSAVPAYSGSMATGSTLPSLGDIASALAFRETIRQQARRESLLKPPRALSVASAQISQVALGTFAGQIVDEQQERLRQMHAATAARKKRKRNNSKLVNGGNDNDNEISKAAIGPIGPILKIRRVHVDGFEIPQIWQQANRILDTSVQQTKYALERLDEEDQEEEAAAEAAANGVDSDEDVDDELSGDEEEESEEEEEEEDDEELSMGEDGEDDFDMEDEDEDEDEDDEEEEDDEDEELENGPTKEFVADPSGLNDGFFDIDEFNKQSQWFEAQDARADPNTDAASDDGELDWHADPFSVAGTGLDGKEKKKKKNGKAGKGKAGKKNKGRGQSDSDDEDDVSLLGGGDADEDDEENDDDGPPIFSDMDLDAPSGESDMEDEAAGDGGLASGMDMDMGADDIFYNDFFAPPAQKRGERDRPGRRSQAARDNNNEDKNKKPFQPDEEDVQRAMNDVRRDLFEQLSDDDDNNDDDDEDGIDALSDVSAGDVRGRRSAHERRQAKILAEIRRLEAEAIKEKKWALAGEASAGARPVNSLLEEDLDFEHTGKPVPVITQEVTEDIEALVKRRILEQSFDEVRRRYGTGFGEDEDGRTRRGLVELDDQQSKKGLADVYEETYQAAAHADTHVSQADERQQSDEREVERLWLDISAKLDALSNWQYKPRPAAPQMSVVADVAAVTMEDAQPSTAQGVSGGASLLAPQEVYKPGADDKEAGKNKDKNIIVVAKSGLPVARDEMTREEKQRRRRRNKERIRKSGSGMQGGGGAAAGVGSGKTSGKTSVSQKDTMATLKKAGVKVIGKKGELHDLEGNKPRAAQTVSSNYFKL